MIQKEDRLFNNIGGAIFALLIFFFLLSFSNKPEKPQRNKITIEYAVKSYSAQSNVLPVSMPNLPVFNKEWLSFADDISCKLPSLNSKRVYESRKIIIYLSQLNKDYLHIKSKFLDQNIHCYHEYKTDFLPILS